MWTTMDNDTDNVCKINTVPYKSVLPIEYVSIHL